MKINHNSDVWPLELEDGYFVRWIDLDIKQFDFLCGLTTTVANSGPTMGCLLSAE